MNSATIPLDNRKDKDNSDTNENRKDKDNSDTDDNRANIHNHYKQEQKQSHEQKYGHLHGFNNNKKNSYANRDDQADKTRENIIPIFSNRPHPHPHPHSHPNLHTHPRSGLLVAAADDVIIHQQHSSSADNGLITKNTMTQTDTETHTQTETHTHTHTHAHSRTEIKKETKKERVTLELFASQSPSEFIIKSQDESPYPTDIKAYTGKLRLYAISYGKRKGGFFSLLFLFLVGKK